MSDEESIASSGKGKYYVYALAYPDGRFFYIGKGKGRRIKQHRPEARRTNTDGSYSVDSHKCRVIRRLWAIGEDYQEIILAHHTTDEEAFLHEIALITLSNADDILTNCTNGGEGLLMPSEETRKKLRERQLNRTAEHQLKIITALKGRPSPMKGKKHTQESILKMSIAQKNRGYSPMRGKSHNEETRLKIKNALKGRPLPEETRLKISDTKRGKTVSEETRRKIAEGNKGKTVSEETRRKIAVSSKGKIISEETRRKLGEASRNRSEETRRKIGEAARNRSEETRRKLSEATKARWSLRREQI